MTQTGWIRLKFHRRCIAVATAVAIASLFVIAFPFFSALAANTTLGQPPLIAPKLGVPIPGLVFSTQPQFSPGANGDLHLAVPFIAQYISAIYQYLIGISIIAAAIMIVYGGVLYIIGSSMMTITNGKEIIKDAIIGLFLVIAMYTILKTINSSMVTPKPILLKPIVNQQYQYMLTNGMGFSDTQAPPSPEINEVSSGGTAPALGPPGSTIPLPSSGPPSKELNPPPESVVPSPTEEGQEGFKLKPYQRLATYCTPKTDATKLKNYDEKIPALVRAVLGFKKVCIDEHGCAYIRTAYTNLTTGHIFSGAGDFPFFLHSVKRVLGHVDWYPGCKAAWNSIGKNKFYKDYHPPTNNPEISAFVWGTINVGTKKNHDLIPAAGTCYKKIKAQYTKDFVGRLQNGGIFGGDCGSTLAQIYSCAGAKTSRPFQSIIAWANRGKNFPDVIVYKAKNAKSFEKQLSAHPVKFGDIVDMGNLGTNHNFMYTGGRADVPFDIIEMGGGVAADGTVGSKIRGAGFNFKVSIGGMRVQGHGTFVKYVENYAFGRHYRGPVTIIRPYQFKSCSSKADCGPKEACHCTAYDGGHNWANNKCGYANICHHAKGGYCNKNEQCPNGETCHAHFCKPAPAT